MPHKPQRFSDFADERPLDGAKARIEDVLNQEILVLAFKIRGSKFDGKTKSGKCLTLQFELEGHHRVLFTGSEVLLEQAEKYKDRMPFLATIKKIDRYYTFT